MLLGIAGLLGIVLVAVAMLPRRMPGTQPQLQPIQSPQPMFAMPAVLQRQASLREQQVTEESTAIAGEYQRRADAAWMEELRARAALLLNSTT